MTERPCNASDPTGGPGGPGPIGEHPLFAGLDPAALAALTAASTRVDLNTGDTLMVEAEPGDAAYLVLGGRFLVSVGDRAVGQATRGDMIGEMALLVDEPRSATVVALRAAAVLRLDGPSFTAALAEQPALQRRVNAQLVERLRRANLGPAPRGPGRVVAVVRGPEGDFGDVPAELTEAIGRLGRRAVTVAVGSAGVSSAEVTRLELDHDVVLLLAPPGDRQAIDAACSHADIVVVIADGSAVPVGAEHFRLPARLPPVELVLVHPASTSCPRGTHRWLARLQPRTHHHVRAGERAHVERLARRLLGCPVGLVLSGGGARGLAHIGTYRALCEHHIPIDVIAGTSAGSIFAVSIARGWDAEHTTAVATRLLVDGGSLVDATLPTVALASGRRITRRIRDAFGDDDLRLEDLWIPTLIVSANLTTAAAHEHTNGPAWRAVRASVAIPGVFPPIAEPEGLLVDGGLVDNLPVARLRAHHPGVQVIGSDVGRRIEFLPDGFPPDGDITGWSAWRLRRRSKRSGAARPIPGVISLLGRLTALGGAGTPIQRGDVHIDHPLPGIGMFDFPRGRTVIDAGYRTARDTLANEDVRSTLGALAGCRPAAPLT